MIDLGVIYRGTLFTNDYLVDAIRGTHEYQNVAVRDLRQKLNEIATRFPRDSKTNESQTEDDFIWPVLAELGWTDSLRQQNLSSTGRQDVPDGN